MTCPKHIWGVSEYLEQGLKKISAVKHATVQFIWWTIKTEIKQQAFLKNI